MNEFLGFVASLMLVLAPLGLFAAVPVLMVLRVKKAVDRHPASTATVRDDAESLARRKQMSSLASGHGWQFIARDDTFVTRWDPHVPRVNWAAAHPLLKVPLMHRRCDNIVVGTYRGRPFVTFDLMAASDFATEALTGPMRTTIPTVQAGDQIERYKPYESAATYSVVAVHTGVVLPPLAVVPENAATRRVASVLGRDHLLESEDFNRAFTVKAQDAKFASDVLHPRAMQAFLAHPDAHWEILGPDLMSIYRNSPVDEQTLFERLDLLHLAVASIPEHVWRERRGAT